MLTSPLLVAAVLHLPRADSVQCGYAGWVLTTVMGTVPWHMLRSAHRLCRTL